MGFFDGIKGLAGIALDPLLSFPPLFIVLLISLVVALITVFVYKYFTNQELMKELKEKTKHYQQRMKELRGNPEKAMEVQKEAMNVQMKYMGHSLRISLVTLLPLLLIYGWLNANLAFVPLAPLSTFTIDAVMEDGASGLVSVVDIVPEGLNVMGEEAVEIVDGKASFDLKGQEGSYLVTFAYNDETATRSVLVTQEQKYEPQLAKVDGSFKSLNIAYDKLVILPIGFRNWFGWLGLYILFSIIFSSILRKVFKVY